MIPLRHLGPLLALSVAAVGSSPAVGQPNASPTRDPEVAP